MTSLTAEQAAKYRRDGYAILRGLFSREDVGAWAAECKRLLRLGIAHKDNQRTLAHYLTETMYVIDRFDPVIDISPVFMELARDSRITKPLSELCGEDVLLFKDRLIYKMVGTTGYPIHQDYSWWQAFSPDVMNVILAIDAADAENGAVELFPGYHDRLLSAPGEMRHMNAEEAEQIDLTDGEMFETQPGDMIIFHCLTPHRSGPNRSNRLRRQVYFSYSPARHGDLYETQLRLFKQGLASRRISEEDKERLTFR